jgi:hypothetical protein
MFSIRVEPTGEVGRSSRGGRGGVVDPEAQEGAAVTPWLEEQVSGRNFPAISERVARTGHIS